MKLYKFEIRNFKGIEHASFEWDRFVVLIGENNVGKSSVLQALSLFLSGSSIKDEQLCRNHVASPESPVELIGYFNDLTPSENAEGAVSGRTLGNSWILKKAYWRDEAGSWKEQYFSMAQAENFADWPDTPNSWGAFPESYKSVLDAWADKGARPSAVKCDHLKELLRAQKPELVTLGEAEWIANPGGGGNWKSNANSILPRPIFIKAVHRAADETISKEASSYGKIISLIVEKKMMNRPEITALRHQMQEVLKLFTLDEEHPEQQAQELRDIQDTINKFLNEVVAGTARIKTSEPDLEPLLLPNTSLVIKSDLNGVETEVEHQGDGLQRSLIITLLQVLAAVQSELDEADGAANPQRPSILLIEEPELYLHPQMERKMRDLLYRVSSQDHTQVICCTHSPVFLDMGQKHKSIVRVVREDGNIQFKQVLSDLFDGPDANDQKERLKFLSEFHSSVNEVFFAKRAILLEGRTEIIAFEYAAEATGVFQRHPNSRRDVTMLNCGGKSNILLFQRVLNHFILPYLAVYDEDTGNAISMADNPKIDGLVAHGHANNKSFRVSPNDIETLLGYHVGNGPKPFLAQKRISQLIASTGLPAIFVEAMNNVYFGQAIEPAP